MSVLRKKTYLTEVAYLEFEALSDFKNEYIDGEIYAMAGASERHNRITGNVFFQLRMAARGSTCGVFASDMKLRMENGKFYYYPDVMLVCNDADSHAMYKEQPCLIVEVLSTSTRKTDQCEKWLNYQKIPSLKYYLLVDSMRQKVHYFMRDNAQDWYFAELEKDESIAVHCGDYQTSLTLNHIYEDVIFDIA